MAKNLEIVNIAGKDVEVKKSKFALNASPVFISDYMSGKMAGFPSISTNNLDNEICKARRNMSGMVCNKCFAAGTASRYSDLSKNLSHNTEVLKDVLPLDVLPVFGNVRYVRFESFGDLFCVNQIINYFNICRVNPDVRFTLWTKNPGFIAAAIRAGHEKPENMKIIVSSPYIDKALDLEKVKRVFPFTDVVFTVYAPATIEKENININCGARDCMSCANCYRKNSNPVVNEKLK